MWTEPPPPTLSKLLADRDAVKRRYPLTASNRIRVSRAIPWFYRALGMLQHDTPLASLYRLYEFFVIDWTTQLRNELEYFCREHHDWLVSAIPDPADPDPVRYAILAALTTLMCEAFNRRVDLGLPRDAPPIIEDFEALKAQPKIYEQPPKWAEDVSPLPEIVYIPDANGQILEEHDSKASKEFKRWNIVVCMPHLHFV
ncbi:hypothetical protein WOLCODRAFT_133750 [Wolfiporia cocos MD-104 SS10]|uniref:Uncharacterized protein n=1 Tax=Wolfiporia cocos (strain MD-104) TaxID=742152 RepID=A0A2H3JGK3_WOLCO|nr:hypothetical protein WOLCODRAFT_133750 [Wolfiporia cocos MD-104 SS10]